MISSVFSPLNLATVPPTAGFVAQGSGSGPAGEQTAIVVGSGFGGLSAAIRLSAMGYQVTVLEKLDGPGGRGYVRKQDGFIFDGGPTIVTVPFLFEELWELCGKKFSDDVNLRLMDPFYRVRFDDGTHFDYNGDPARMRAEVVRISPEDAAGFDRFVLEADKCYRLGFETLGCKAFDSIGDLVAALPAMMKMKAWRTMYSLVAGYIKHPKLRMAMSLQTLLIGGNPFSVTGVYSLINALERRFGVYSAMGGTGSIINGMVKLLTERGVPVRYNAEVKQIIVEGGRATGIQLASGEKLAADIVVCNSDTSWTYKNLIAPHQWRINFFRVGIKCSEAKIESILIIDNADFAVEFGCNGIAGTIFVKVFDWCCALPERFVQLAIKRDFFVGCQSRCQDAWQSALAGGGQGCGGAIFGVCTP